MDRTEQAEQAVAEAAVTEGEALRALLAERGEILRRAELLEVGAGRLRRRVAELEACCERLAAELDLERRSRQTDAAEAERIGVGPIGRLVVKISDDADVPLVGEVLALADDPDYVTVAWGEDRCHPDGSASGTLEALDELTPWSGRRLR